MIDLVSACTIYKKILYIELIAFTIIFEVVRSLPMALHAPAVGRNKQPILEILKTGKQLNYFVDQKFN